MTTTEPAQPMATTTAAPPASHELVRASAPTRVRDWLNSGPRIARWPDVAVGAAFQAEAAAAGLISGLRRVTARPGPRLSELAERGAVERARGQRRAAETVQAAVHAAATSPVVNLAVDAQLERLLRPVVLAVLDDVLLLLENEPDRIQSLIRGQRDSMADELVSRIRSGAAAGDTAVDRLAFRVFHRGPQPMPAPPPSDGP